MTEAAAPSPPATKSMIRSVETDPELLEDMMGEKFPYRPVLWAGMMSYRVVVAILTSLFTVVFPCGWSLDSLASLLVDTCVISTPYDMCQYPSYLRVTFLFVGSILSLASPEELRNCFSLL